MLDTTEVYNEEEIQIAGFVERGLAMMIDGIIIFLFSYIAYTLLFIDVIGPLFLVILPNAFEWGPHVAFLFLTIIIWLYVAGTESSRYGGTVGKYFLKLKVTDEDGESISFKVSSTRFFIKIFSLVFIFAGFVMALFTKQKQTLHDLAAHTIVVKKEVRP